MGFAQTLVARGGFSRDKNSKIWASGFRDCLGITEFPFQAQV